MDIQIILFALMPLFNIHSFHWHMQNATIPCRSQELLPSSLTSSCHLFLGLPFNLVVPKFIYNTLLGLLISSILCTCPNQCNLFNLIVSTIVGFLTLALLVNIPQFPFSLSYTGPKILLYNFLSKTFNCCLSLLVSKFLIPTLSRPRTSKHPHPHNDTTPNRPSPGTTLPTPHRSYH